MGKIEEKVAKKFVAMTWHPRECCAWGIHCQCRADRKCRWLCMGV